MGHVHEQNIVIDQGLNIVPPGAQERALKNLPAASGAQRGRIPFIIRLGTVIGLNFNGQFRPVDIGGQQNRIPVRVNAAHQFSVDADNHLRRRMQAQIHPLPGKAFRNVRRSADKGRAIRGEHHIPAIQRPFLPVHKFIGIFTDLMRITDPQAGDFLLICPDAPLKPGKTQVRPLFRAHGPADNFYMSHTSPPD